MNGKQRLQLTWIGKEDRPRLEPRILLEESECSYRGKSGEGRGRIADNRVIFGDNLLALKALESEFAGQIKCIYIDPPYNTGSAFERYDDGLEHSVWLTLIRDRLELLRNLLAPEGSIWVSIDDSEMAYLRVLMDEIFGRSEFIACNVWQKRFSRENREAIGDAHEYILVYARNAADFSVERNLLPLGDKQRRVYSNPDDDPRGPWQSVSLLAQGYRPNQMYEITAPSGARHVPPAGNCWKLIRAEYDKLIADNRIWFGQSGNGVPRRKYFLSEAAGLVPWTWWPHQDVGHTGEAKKEVNALFGADVSFDTPKPERLIRQILEIATNEGDLVLDSFAGSGTTGAVAHKMRRRWIMIEQGEHAHTHILPRIRKVIDGVDPGGVTETTGWKGGGSFRYFRLAPSLIELDEWGNEVISSKYNAAMLTEAMCKHMGFNYAPDPDHFWMHGRSTECDFIYVTTASLTHEQLKKISDLVGPERTLLVCCRAFQKGHVARLENLTVRKIPQVVLSKCEWGKDDYSMGLAEAAPLPEDEEAAEAASNGKGAEAPKPRKRKKPRSKAPPAPSLFDEEGKA